MVFAWIHDVAMGSLRCFDLCCVQMPTTREDDVVDEHKAFVTEAFQEAKKGSATLIRDAPETMTLYATWKKAMYWTERHLYFNGDGTTSCLG